MEDASDFLRSYGWLALVTVPALALWIRRLTNRVPQRASAPRDRDNTEFVLPCELRLFRRSHRSALQIAEAVAALVALAAVGALVYRTHGGAALPKLSLGLIAEIVLLAVTSWLSLRAMLRSGIRLDHDGVHYRSGVPSLLQSFHPDWSAALLEIESVGFDRSLFGHPTAWRMIIRTHATERKIPAWGWVYRLPSGAEVTDGAPQPWTPPPRYPSPDGLPLVRFFREQGLAVDTEPKAPKQADLLRSLPARVLLGVAIVAVAYAAAEGVVGTETYSNPAAAGNVLAVLGLGAAAVSALWLGRGKSFNAVETIAVSAVVGVAIGIAGYPAGLRLNAWSDPHEPTLYRYLHQGGDLVPISEGAPDLDFWFKEEYLAAFDPGTEHEVAVRHGGLGFLQIRKTELLRRLDACGGSCLGRSAQR